jgi:membrane protease YdiL (CAAX protease family)
VNRTARRLSGHIVPVTFCVVFAVYVAWVGAWLLKRALDRHVAWITSSGGAFAYWAAMKLLLWIVPSVAVLRLSGRRVRTVLGMERLRPVLAWGVGTGLVLGVISLITKAVMHRPLLALTLSWPQFSVLVIAPVFEEFMFRGAVLGNLMQRYRFPLANTLTAALFLGLHLPGWHFQGRLWMNLTSPVGGALSIFLLGLVFGFVAHRSKSVVAGMIAHSLNNLFS